MNRFGQFVRGIRRYRVISTAALSASLLLISGCATHGNLDDSRTERRPCPRDMKLQCFEDQGTNKRCSCVSSGEMEEMLEELTGIKIH